MQLHNRIAIPPISGDYDETTARLQQVFPMITRVINGQHTAQLSQKLQFVDGRWEAVVAVE